jgi:hypothetical protein
MKIAIEHNSKFKYYNCRFELLIENKTPNSVVAIYDDNDNFLARGCLYKLNDEFSTVTGVVARKGFGKMLYETLAMIAHQQKIFMCTEREGGSPNEKIWELYKNIYNEKNIIKKPIDDKYSVDYFVLNKKSNYPEQFTGYQLAPSTSFINSIVGSTLSRELIDKCKTFFDRAYEKEGMSNDWIDEEYPLINIQEIKEFVNKKTIKTKNKKPLI